MSEHKVLEGEVMPPGVPDAVNPMGFAAASQQLNAVTQNSEMYRALLGYGALGASVPMKAVPEQKKLFRPLSQSARLLVASVVIALVLGFKLGRGAVLGDIEGAALLLFFVGGGVFLDTYIEGGKG